MYIYIHGFHIKIYRNFDGVPPIPKGPQLSTCNMFTLLIIASHNLIPTQSSWVSISINILTPITHNIHDIHYITKYHYGWIKKYKYIDMKNGYMNYKDSIKFKY